MVLNFKPKSNFKRKIFRFLTVKVFFVISLRSQKFVLMFGVGVSDEAPQ